MLSRASLKEMGMEPVQIDKIMELHGASTQSLKAKSGALKENLITQIRTLKEELTVAKDSSYKVKYEAEVEAHKATVGMLEVQKETVADFLAKEEDAAVDGLVKELLVAGNDVLGKMHPAACAKALKSYDRAIVRRNSDGNIENGDEVLSYFAGEWSDFFGKVQMQGVDVGSPYGGAAPPAYTKEAIAKMSASEINKNWDSIKGVIA